MKTLYESILDDDKKVINNIEGQALRSILIDAFHEYENTPGVVAGNMSGLKDVIDKLNKTWKN